MAGVPTSHQPAVVEGDRCGQSPDLGLIDAPVSSASLEAAAVSAGCERRGGRRCRLRWALGSLGRTRRLAGLAPPCLTSLPQLALLLVLLPALLYPNTLSGSETMGGAGVEGGRALGGGGGVRSSRARAPLAGAAAEGAGGQSYTGMVDLSKAACSEHDYTPGNYTMLLDARNRQLGQSALGDRSRLLAALQRYREGGTLTVGVIGGSIAAGQGAHDAPAFPYWLKQILEAELPGGPQRVRLNNGAMPGTSSAYMSTCHNVHVPPDADIVVLDYAINDEEMPMPHMNNGVRRPYERLIRKLLQYPKRPAVVLLHAFRWFQDPVSSTGQFWSSSERQHGEFGLYYGLQQLSVKACCYHLMRQDRDGFSVKRPRADHTGRPQHDMDAALKGKVFFFDVLHPDGHTGHRVMGELVAQLVLDAWAEVSSGSTLSAEDTAAIAAPLPPPMLEANMESASDHCFIGPALQQTVIHRQSFEWLNEGKNPLLPKWGYVATIPGADIKFKVNSKATGTRHQEVTVELGYLRSYENMGRANVSCEGGCTCATWTLDGHHDQRNSQTFLQGFPVSQAEECIIAVKVLETSSTGKHKVKISGVMVSEDPENRPFDNKAAWDWIIAGSSKSAQGVFDLKSVVRRSLLATHQASSAALQQRYQQAALRSGGAGGAAAGDIEAEAA